jgi:transglutaminase-like putative cysteine protease
MEKKGFENYLCATEFLDFEAESVQNIVRATVQNEMDDREKAVALYLQVRDGWLYDPYRLDFSRDGMPASQVAQRNSAYCIEKAILLAACWRAVGVPSRLFFANVKNHLATAKLEKILGTNVLVFHGAAEAYLNNKWVKATPAFNLSLCEKMSVPVLNFTGDEDSIFQEKEGNGRLFMEYVHTYGSFEEMPYELMTQELYKAYSHIFNEKEKYEVRENVYVLNI